MPEVILDDIPVHFPFEPYEVQKDYMRKVLECLKKGVNGVLESPTGTGKTLSLLCSSLAWLEVKKAQTQAALRTTMDSNIDLLQSLNKATGVTKEETQSWGSLLGVPRIIYASRTHSQIGQVVAELKRTKYNHVKVAVLGSRDQLCLHPDILNEQNNGLKVSMCRMKVSSRSCHFYNNVESRKNDPAFAEIMDIEDLVTKGKKVNCCPYYLTRELHKFADIVFVPYNYLLDSKIRELQDISVANNVIILDEGHNVEKMCEESSSFQLSSTDIAVCMTEVTQVMHDMVDEVTSKSFDDPSSARDFTADDLCILKVMFAELEKAVDSVEVGSTPGLDSDRRGSVYPGSYILDILSKADITPDKLSILSEMLHKVSQYLTTISGSSYQHRGAGLQKFFDFTKVIAKSLGPAGCRENADKFYKVFIEPEVSRKGWGDRNSWAAKATNASRNAKLINFWCFSAGYGMRSLMDQGVRCIILTSGTLAPLDATISELGIPVEVRLENPHIVQGDQVCVSVVKAGPTNKELKSTFENRNNAVYLKELAFTIQNFSRVVPHGLLVFFPSYSAMESTATFWQQEGLWSRIANSKPIFMEPHQKDALADVMKQYYEAVDNANSTKGAILLAVCRGKVSEGLDFANGRGRAVIITGLPFPPYKDPRVVLKRQYIDQNRNKLQTLTGADWYRLEATRAVNQAIGRVIRHADDYGAIILCDSRFGISLNTKSLSKWLQPHVKMCDHFRLAYSSLVAFFRNTGSLKLSRGGSNAPGGSFVYGAGEVRDCEKKEPEAEKKTANTNGDGSQCKQLLMKIYGTPTPKSLKKPSKPDPKDLLAALDSAEEMSNSFKADEPSSCEQENTSFVAEDALSNMMDEFLTPKNSLGETLFDSATHSARSSSSLTGSATKKRKVIIVERTGQRFGENASSGRTGSLSSSNDVSTGSTATFNIDEVLDGISVESASAVLTGAALILNEDTRSLKEKVSVYWWLVKRQLSSEQFEAFKESIFEYKTDSDYDKFVTSMKIYFPLKDPKMRILFRSLFFVLRFRHKTQFQKLLEQLQMS